jgi:TonB family protein
LNCARPNKCQEFLLRGQLLESRDSLEAAKEAYLAGFRWGMVDYSPGMEEVLATLKALYLELTDSEWVRIKDTWLTRDLRRARETGTAHIACPLLDTIPSILYMPSFPWPGTTIQRGRRLRAVVGARIDKTGSVVETKLAVSSSVPAYDTFALEVSRQAIFTPPLWQGRRVGTLFLLPCEASLE